MTAFELAAKITLDASGFNSSLNDTEQKMKKAGDKLSSKSVAIGHLISDVAKSAYRTTANMVKSFVKGAYDSFASYEQLEGGIETIFKKDIDPRAFSKVMANARQAFETTGQSANQYMETVTAFSASLLQGLEGDTLRAAEVADMAMRDMADNANKMGSSMDSIENAYKGFAKQNYTMLDNLKIGYGGTKTEMERLLKDAQKLTGKKYNLNNLADVYEAIHEIQTELGITGTTSKEASTTVEGSTKAMKASWENLLTAIGRGKGIKTATKDFTKSLKTMLKNSTHVVRDIISSIPEVISEIMPEVKNLIDELGKGLFGKNWDITINWIQNAWEDVKGAFDIATKWIGLTWKITVNWMQTGWNFVKTSFDTAKPWIDKAWNDTVNWMQTGWDFVNGTFNTAKPWIDKAWDTTVNWVRTGWNFVSNAFDTAEPWINRAWDTTVNWVRTGWGFVNSAFNTATPWINRAWDTTVNWAQTSWDFIKNSFDTARQWVNKTWNTVVKWEQTAWEDINNAFDKAADWINKSWQTTVNWGQTGWAFVNGTFNTAKQWVNKTWNTVVKWGQTAWEDVENAIKQVAKGTWDNVVNFNLGLFKGVTDFIQNIPKSIDVAVNFVKKSAQQAAVSTFVDVTKFVTGLFGYDAKGAWDVPYDDYYTRLHRNEMVLSASQARQYREGKTGEMDYEAVGNMIGGAVENAMSRVYVMMSGEKVGDLTTRRVKKNINATNYSKLRALGG